MSLTNFFNIQLFAEAGEAAGAGDAGQMNGAATAAADGQVAAVSEPAQNAGSPAEEASGGTDGAAAGKMSYAEIRQMYGKEIDAEMNAAIKKRLQKSGRAEENFNLIKPLADRAFRRYGVREGDYKALRAAVDADTDYYEQLAEQKGTTADMERQLEESMRRARESTERLEEIEEENRVREQFGRIAAQIADVRTIAPDFDLDTEMQNPTFAAMARGGFVSLKDAYRAVHFDELTSHAMEVTAKATAQKVSNAVKSGGARENGMGASAPASFKTDPSKFSAKEINSIIERAKRGEIIRFS